MSKDQVKWPCNTVGRCELGSRATLCQQHGGHVWMIPQKIFKKNSLN